MDKTNIFSKIKKNLSRLLRKNKDIDNSSFKNEENKNEEINELIKKIGLH